MLRTTVLLATVVVATVALEAAVPGVTDPGWVQTRIADLGPLAPVAFVALQAVQVVVAPLPGQLMAGVGGYLFGVVAGTAYSLLGVAIGSAIVFSVTRRYGRPYLERVVAVDALARWDRFVADTGAPGLFVLFLLPTFPDDVLCFVAGLTDLRLRTFLVLVLVGRGPSFLAVVYAGTRLADDGLTGFAVVATGIGVATVAVYLARYRIIAGIERVT